MKTKTKSAKAKEATRKHTDWAKFFSLCKAGKSNAEIAKALGWRIHPKSADPMKRVRAAKSLARTQGIVVDGKRQFLRDREAKPKPDEKRMSAKPTSRNNPTNTSESPG